MNKNIREILEKEKIRQDSTIELIASENFASQSVMDLCGSIFTNKYAEGLPGRRYYNGCEHMDEIENLAMDQLRLLYGCNFANVQPHSGANANLAVFLALLEPGDTILGMDLASGGHLTHGAKVNVSGKWFNSVSYGVDDSGFLSYGNIFDLAKKHKPKLIVAGASAYPRQIRWDIFGNIAKEFGAFLMVDMAHYSGLIAGGMYDNPIDFADVVTSTTHKTLRGPRGGVILWKDKSLSRRINSAVFPGTQGGPLMNIIAAKAQCFAEALDDSFTVYARNVVDNTREMCYIFNNRGMTVQTNGTDSHIALINLSESKFSGREAADLLERNGITVNKNGVPNDKRSFTETSGIRIGTAAETTRGHDKQWFSDLANRIADILEYGEKT